MWRVSSKAVLWSGVGDLVAWVQRQSTRNLVPAHPPIITHEMQALAATVANVNRLMPDAGLVAAVLLATV